MLPRTQSHLAEVGVLSLSVTTPGLVPMAADGDRPGTGDSLLRPAVAAAGPGIRATLARSFFSPKRAICPFRAGRRCARCCGFATTSPTCGVDPQVRSYQHVHGPDDSQGSG